MSSLIKYQKFILDVILLEKYKISYELINESKDALLELIYLKVNDLITPEVYKKHHYAHVTRQAFLEQEIDKVRQELTTMFITGAGAKNPFAKSTALADYAIVKNAVKTYVYDIAHTGLFKKHVDQKRMSDRELKLHDFKEKAKAYGEKLMSDNPTLKESFGLFIEDRVLLAICSNNLLVTTNGGYVMPILQVEEVESIIEEHFSKINRKYIPSDTPIKQSFLDYIYERKEQHLAAAAAEAEQVKKLAQPQKRGTNK
ncbi:hypothetical protein GR140_19120 [Pseudomonas putida]|uniref:hypothetical protein n=1 Tax=Pseudomonas putida TaxID=303 RepID=UPI001BAF6B6F|nr:hypothetical protein [Pseudomonas putida]QUG90778.1 hypothetical protein GR140_19120 [Pseudomonas putida]